MARLNKRNVSTRKHEKNKLLQLPGWDYFDNVRELKNQMAFIVESAKFDDSPKYSAVLEG